MGGWIYQEHGSTDIGLVICVHDAEIWALAGSCQGRYRLEFVHKKTGQNLAYACALDGQPLADKGGWFKHNV